MALKRNTRRAVKKTSPSSKKEKKIIKSGIVLEALPSTHFKVKLEGGSEIIAHLAGKMSIYRIKVLPGDKVTVELSPYDEKRGRIIYRRK